MRVLKNTIFEKNMAISELFLNSIRCESEGFFDKFFAHLVDSGFDKEKVTEAFCSFTNSKYKKPPKGRLLPSISPPSTDDENKGKEKPVIVIDYTAKVCALFGDFKKTYVDFKDNVLRKTPGIKGSRNKNLGVFWMIARGRMGEMESALRKAGIKYRKVRRAAYQKEFEGVSPPAQSSSSENEDEKKDEKPQAASSASTPAKTKMTCIRNKWRNIEEKETGFIVVKLPIGEDGKKTIVCVGLQDEDECPDKKGLSSVVCLDDACVAECKKRGWKYFSKGREGSKILGALMRDGGNKPLARELKGILTRTPRPMDSSGEEGSSSDDE